MNLKIILQLQQSCVMLESIEDLCYTPAVVSALVSLHSAQNLGPRAAVDVLQRAIEWHKKHKVSERTVLSMNGSLFVRNAARLAEHKFEFHNFQLFRVVMVRRT